MRWSILVLALFIKSSDAQFGEIASLATSLLGGALGGGGGLGALAGAAGAGAGAAQAGGALAQIGQLYQLAQGALQLTGTGVGVLNQASEGNWFPAVLEQTAKNSQTLMRGNGGNGLNLGALGPVGAKPGAGNSIGPEFGTSFPAPNIDDYDENAEIPGLGKEKKTPTAPDGLIDIDSGDYETDKETTTTTTEPVTLFPDEEEEHTTEPEPTTPPTRQIRIQLPDKTGGKTGTEEELDYEDLIHHKEKGEIVKPVPTIDAESTEELKRNVIATFGTKTQPIVPKLDKLVEVLQKSKLSQEEIEEIVAQVEGNKRQEKPPKFDFNSSVQNIPDKKNQIRQKITDASRVINSNYANERKDQSVVIQQQIDELKIVPDLAQGSHNSPQPNIATPVTVAPRNITPRLPTSPPNVQKPRVHETRSVPNAPALAVVATTVAAPAVPQAPVQPNAQQAIQQPNYNYLYPHQYQQQQQQQQQQYNQYYYNQAPYYGQQTQNYWGQHAQTYPQNNQYNQQQQQQLYYTTTPTAVTYNQQYYQQYHQASQPAPQQQTQQIQAQQQQQYQQQQTQVQNPQQQHQVQQPQQSQQQVQVHLQQGQQVQQPQQVQQTQQYRTQQPQVAVQQSASYSTSQQQFPNKQTQPLLYNQYQQTQSSPAPQHAPSQTPNHVYHYYHDGRQVIQQIIPKQIAANSNLPLNGPFRPQSAGSSAGIKTDPAEYQRSQQTLQQAYSLPQTRSSQHVVTQQAQLSPANNPIKVQPPARQLYESTVTATGNRQAHAIRTYQATKQAVQPKILNSRPVPTQTTKTPVAANAAAKPKKTPQPPTAVRSSGRSAAVQKKTETRKISGHVLPGPVIDHRSLLEKRTTAKPRYVRIP